MTHILGGIQLGDFRSKTGVLWFGIISILFISLAMGIAVDASGGASVNDENAMGNVPPVEVLAALPPEEVIGHAIERCEKLESYRCRLTIHLTRGDRVQDSEYVFFYKKPNLIRLEVKEGKHKGSTVVRRKDGRIRARREGLLSMFAFTLDPEDRRLYDLWDRFFGDSDWVTVLTQTRERLRTVDSASVESVDGGRFILLKASSEDFVERTWLDGDQLVLLKKQARRENGDTLEATWSDIALNPPLDDNLFHF
jgi:outer membrane lipoprotein-sorting protein